MTGLILGIVVLILITLALTGFVMLARRVMMPQHPAIITVNDTNRITSQTGRKLLSALNDNGVLVPSACAGAGTCGQCKVQIVGDAPPPLPVEAARLSPAEVRAGMHLACQVTLRGDTSVHVPDDLLGAEAFEARVASVTVLTPLIREIVLDLPPGTAEHLFAGAFIQITAPPFSLGYDHLNVPERFEDTWEPLRALRVQTSEPTTRAYSIANRPEDTQAGRVVLNIRLALPPPRVAGAPPGIVSSWLFSVEPGDALSVAGPFGTFRVQDTDRELVFLGGGVGMAPLRAMIFEVIARQKSPRKASFWYGARSRDDLFYVDELDTLAAAHENFSWTVALSDPDPDGTWTGPTGFVHTVVWEQYLRDHPNPQDCEFYLCGPPMMMAAVLKMLDDLGVEPAQIFNDDFGV
ncbi:NADH:ubiquinone reductase (Na(+)-transporting) subunit F [Rhodobacteraceae bacterium N5(2021)]|uniref:Na(+)-translocating NADH-quinone reductase subunit F n=1 Tax=Gymnodinialimonas phycosphaerae TaxID=2841589 RepID=A0A975YEN1_9RHOB|nr:NADH:ubiquinone reductase (Na(+)-transporting) subunit F [Gymnodinialimonas phycosphaerae]MBY4893864.1 NADH:ubiquinone reductase (Na(+)-transporting) subunit F [Gymnodinialimonas phycosphaerae]